MTKQKPKKIRKGSGNWIQAIRCVWCNGLSLGEKRIPNSGKILNEEGEKKDCAYMCEKGWYYSKGVVNS